MQVERVAAVIHCLVGGIGIAAVDLVVGHGHVSGRGVAAVALAHHIAAGAVAVQVDVRAAAAAQVIGRINGVIGALVAVARPVALNGVGASRPTLAVTSALAVARA